MRIAMLAWEAEEGILVGSVGRHISALTAALAELGVEVHLLCRSDRTDGPLPQGEGRIHPIPSPTHHDFIEGIQELCKGMVERALCIHASTPFDCIHAHDWVSANAGVWLHEASGLPLIFTLHSIESCRNGGAPLSHEQQRVADHELNGCNHASQILTVSHHLKEEITSCYQVDSSRVTVVYNGVHLERYSAPLDPGAIKAKYAIAPLDPMLLFSGQLEYRLGPDL
ncbi:MAG: glycosyltransferase family 4 protein, partial [Planctomycetota bacterium]